MESNNDQKAFLALLRAGLWEISFTIFSVIFKIAEEQSVKGLVTAGIEHLQDLKLP